MVMSPVTFEPGQRVAVTQQIVYRDAAWTTRVEGQVVRFEQRKTGSWFAHSKDDKLWLDRLVLRKDDGEIVVCNLDRYAHVELLPDPKPASEPRTPADDDSSGTSENNAPETTQESAA